MSLPWITLYPELFIDECKDMGRHYPDFIKDEVALAEHNELIYFGEVKVMLPEGTKKFPIRMVYPNCYPYAYPVILPLESLPELNDSGHPNQPIKVKHFEYRHQMSNGTLCLFEHHTRTGFKGDIISGVLPLSRAEKWFYGTETKRWPPDTIESDLESHFLYTGFILVPRILFGDGLEGYGRFLFTIDYRRIGKDGQLFVPLILTAIIDESSPIPIPRDARTDLSALYPWINNDAWNPLLDISTNDDYSNNGILKKGYWWNLPGEPRPFKTGKGMLEAIQDFDEDIDPWTELSRLAGSELSRNEFLHIGLKYPSRKGGPEWLFLKARQKIEQVSNGGLIIPLEAEKRRRFEESEVRVVKVQKVSPAFLTARNTGVVGSHINTKSIALIGLGALGSQVADLLCKAGVGHFRLCDSDILETGNVARHTGGLSDFGSLKTSVIARQLHEINPYLTITEAEKLNQSITQNQDSLMNFINNVDLVISTIADDDAEAVLNQLAVIANIPVLYGRSIRRASMGRIFLVRPGVDACKMCLAEYLENGRNGHTTPTDWMYIPEHEEEVIYHECSRPVIAGSAMDLSFTATLIARVALDYLEGAELTSNHWIWTKDAATDIDTRLDRPLTVFSGFIEPSDDCTACQEPDVTEVLMPESIYQALKTEVESSPEAETGGILIGYLDDQKRAQIQRITGPGPKAKRSAGLFLRDTEYTQMELDKASKDLGEKGKYIGEWHSHLVPDPEPSVTDTTSLFDISEATHYLTRCPVMVIAGYDSTSKSIGNVRSWAYMMSGRSYSIELTIK